jgi:hypothetical protein
VIEDGQAMWVLGGQDAAFHPQHTTQIVRHGKPTQPGPDLTDWAAMHCSATLHDGSVIITGGRRPDNPYGSARTEMLNFTTQKWSKLSNMQQGRVYHSCTQVWLDPDDPDDILRGSVTKTSVMGVVVAGGKKSDSHV